MTPLNTLLKDNHPQPSSSRNMKLSFSRQIYSPPLMRKRQEKKQGQPVYTGVEGGEQRKLTILYNMSKYA